MGHPKQKWTRQEEEALRAGVSRYGTGKWKAILDDPEFRTALAARSNIDLKDKWRNIGMSASSQESRDRVKTTKSKDHPLILPPNLEIPFPLATEQNPSIGISVDPLQTLSYGKSASPFMNPFPLATEQNPFIGMAVDPLNTPSYGRSASWYNAQTCEALSTMNKPNGSETNSGMGYIEDKWRNLGISASSQESRDRVKTTKFKDHPPILPPNLEIPFPLATEQNSSIGMAVDPLKTPSFGMAVDPLKTPSYGKSASPFVNPFPLATEQNPFIGMAVDPLKTPSYGKSASWYNAQTCEALSTMNKPNGSETNSGMGYIEVGNCYNIIKHGVLGQNPSFVEKQNEEYCQKQLQVCAVKTVGVEIQAAAKAAACKLAIAEQADGQAISVAEKANKAADLADHSDSVLQLAEYIFNKCYHGDVVLLI